MASRTGVPTVIKLTRRICYYVGRYGVAGLETATTPEFATALFALVAACTAWAALDDQPGQVDKTAPFGSEDEAPGA